MNCPALYQLCCPNCPALYRLCCSNSPALVAILNILVAIISLCGARVGFIIGTWGVYPVWCCVLQRWHQHVTWGTQQYRTPNAPCHQHQGEVSCQRSSVVSYKPYSSCRERRWCKIQGSLGPGDGDSSCQRCYTVCIPEDLNLEAVIRLLCHWPEECTRKSLVQHLFWSYCDYSCWVCINIPANVSWRFWPLGCGSLLLGEVLKECTTFTVQHQQSWTQSHPRRCESSSRLVWQPQILHECN